MAAAKSKSVKVNKVVGPLATPYLDTGERVYLYEGAQLPSNLREGEAERLTDLGLVEEVEVPADAVADDGDSEA